MSSNTKILVLKAREIIYTLIFAILGIGLICLLIYMFSDKDENSTTTTSIQETSEATDAMSSATVYIPGNYSGDINLGGSSFTLDVFVDDQCIIQASIANLDENTTAMYPLLLPTIENINNQLSAGVTLDAISYTTDNKYTTLLLTDSIQKALDNQ